MTNSPSRPDCGGPAERGFTQRGEWVAGEGLARARHSAVRNLMIKQTP
ncbi:hypothetical protein [Streptomyces tsukubensis]|nr:hypothetical protein [Streptomyces tsukubensis]